MNTALIALLLVAAVANVILLVTLLLRSSWVAAPVPAKVTPLSFRGARSWIARWSYGAARRLGRDQPAVEAAGQCRSCSIRMVASVRFESRRRWT